MNTNPDLLSVQGFGNGALRAGEVALVEHLGRFPASTWLELRFYMIQRLLLDPAGTAHVWYTLRQVGTRTYKIGS